MNVPTKGLEVELDFSDLTIDLVGTCFEIVEDFVANFLEDNILDWLETHNIDTEKMSKEQIEEIKIEMVKEVPPRLGDLIKITTFKQYIG